MKIQSLFKRHKFTVDDYYKMDEVGILPSESKVELLKGEIIFREAQTPYHVNVASKLLSELYILLARRYRIRARNPIHINDYSEPEPDIAIVKKRENYYYDRHPIPNEVFLIIEVSETHLQKDRKIKLPIYAEAKIPEYWIVNLIDEQIEVYRNPKGEKYSSKKIYKKGKTIKCSQLEFELKVSDLF